MSLLTSWKAAMSRTAGSGGDSDGSNDDPQQDVTRTDAFPGEETDETEPVEVGASTLPTSQGGAVDSFLRRLSSLGKSTKEKIDDDTNGRPQDSPSPPPPPNRRRWSLRKFTEDPFKAIKMTKDDEAATSGTDGPQQPSPTSSSHRRRWSLLPKLTENLNNAKLDEVAPCDDNHRDTDDTKAPGYTKTSPVKADSSVIVVDTRCISDIQSEAQRVCSVMSGDAKRHLKILRSIDPTNPVLADVKAAIAEANVWLAECIAPTDGSEENRLKVAKITQQFHAERCLLHANTMARTEIKRLSDLATKNAVAARSDHGAAPPLHRTRSF